MSDHTEQIILALNENIKATRELIIIVNQTQTNRDKDLIDLIKTRADVGRIWMVAFFGLAGFILVLVTIFLGFLNSK